MVIETLHKTFNKQTNYLGHGNVIANTQYSTIVRPSNYRSDYIDKDHQAQDYDINNLEDFCGELRHFRDNIKNMSDDNNGIYVYLLFHWHNHNKIFHGVIFGTKDKHRIITIPFNGKEKSFDVLYQSAKKIGLTE